MRVGDPDGGPFQAAVIGQPISHSRSPDLHRAAYAFLNAAGAYKAVEVAPADLGTFMDGFREDLLWRGLSVTMPHKRAVIEYLDRTHEPATTLGTVNTVCALRSSGGGTLLEGHNTDVQGIVSALEVGGYTGSNGGVVLGGGGTAAAVISALAGLGVRTLTLGLREPGKATPLVQLAEVLGVDLHLGGFDQALAMMERESVTISALPPHAGDPVAAKILRSRLVLHHAVLLDVAYDPWPSALATAWQGQGGTVVSGMEMLIHQAAEQVLLFTGATRELLPGVIKAMYEAVGPSFR